VSPVSGDTRWDRLFGDLEAVLESEDQAAFDADVADRARAEQAALTLADRLAGQVGGAVTCRLVEGEPVSGTVREVGAQWLMLDTPGPLLVPLAAVVAVSGLSRAASPADGALLRRLPLTVVLRGLARDRATVRIRLRGGVGAEGTIDRVAVDHLDLAEHPADEPRRPSAVRSVLTVHLDALLAVRIL
jgi:hypothetical protein